MERLDAKRKMVAVLCIAAILMALLILYGLFDPEQSRWFPQCLFFKLTGWRCPGCGAQRAIHQLLHGNIAAAFRYNALLVCFIPPVAVLLTAGLLRERCPRLYRASHHPAILWSFAILTLLWWVIRNIIGW